MKVEIWYNVFENTLRNKMAVQMLKYLFCLIKTDINPNVIIMERKSLCSLIVLAINGRFVKNERIKHDLLSV